MAKKPQPGSILDTPQAAKLLKDKAAMERLLRSPDTQALMAMLERQGGLQAAAQAAMKGDPTQLQSLVNRLTQDPAAADVVERLSQNAPKG